MPPSATARRKVRCPKCTAILTEPETQIYECPICSTYLLAKGYGMSRSSDKKPIENGGDVEDAKKATDEGAKLQKVSLNNDDRQPIQGDSPNIKDFDRAIDPELDTHALSHPTDQTVFKHNLPENGYGASESLSDIQSEKSGEVSRNHAFMRPSSDLNLDALRESEADSSLRSPEVAKASDALQVSTLPDSFESPSFAPSSSRLISTPTISCIEKQSEEMNAGKDGNNDSKESSRAHEEHCAKELADNKEGRFDKQQILVQHKHVTEEAVDQKEPQSRTASKTGSETALSSLLVKEIARGEDSQNNGDSEEKAVVGKFKLFDLSVFGIYNEETYNELQRGKVARYPNLSENSVSGDSVESPDGNKSSSKLPRIAPQDLSSNKESTESVSNKVILHSEKIIGVSEAPVSGAGVISIQTVDKHATQVHASYENNGMRTLDSFLKEPEDIGVGSLDNGKLLFASDLDIDALAKARYGDDLGERELSSESASVDISFGDWRTQPVSKALNNSLDLKTENAELQKGMVDPAIEEDTESSWDDDEELTFSSTAKEDFNVEGMSPMDGTYGSSGVRDGNDEFQVKKTVDKQAFPLRTTALQKFLKRDDEQSAFQIPFSESVMKEHSVLYEAAYVEHYSPPPVIVTQEVSHEALPPASVQRDDTPSMRKLDSGGNALDLEQVNNETEFYRQSISIAHGSPYTSVKESDILTTSERREEDRMETSYTNYPGSKKGFDPAGSSQEGKVLWKADSTRLVTADASSQKLANFNGLNPNRLENPTENQVYLKWEGKTSSIRSLSSTDDEGTHGVASEVGSVSEKDPFRGASLGLIRRLSPGREEIDGSGQQVRDPAGRVSQWDWIGNTEANRQKFGSGERPTSRRTMRSRPPNIMLSDQGPRPREGGIYVEEKRFDSEASGWTGTGKLVDQPAGYVGSGLKLNRVRPDQMSHYVSPGKIVADYSSDHSSRSQDIASHSGHADYLLNSHVSASNSRARAYPLQLPSYGSAALTVPHEEVHSHHLQAHHGVSAACSVCMQQQYIMQHSQMHQSVTPHQCAACTAQASVAHQPIHHEMHGYHMHGLMHLNHTIGHPDRDLPSGEHDRENGSCVHKRHLNMSERRMKLHPPLPGKGAPPYVLCRHCIQLLQVLEHLPVVSGSVQRLHCGACGKTSKFFISQPDDGAPGSSVLSPDHDDFVEMDDKHRVDTSRVYSSGQILSTGVVPPAQRPVGKAKLAPGLGVHQEWNMSGATSHSNAHGISHTQPDLAGNHIKTHVAATTDSGQTAYGSRHVNTKHASNDAGPVGEDYYSSSASSASGTSPERSSQPGQDYHQAQAVATWRTSRNPKYTLDSATPWTVHEKVGSPGSKFSDSFRQTGAIEYRSRGARTSLQDSVSEPYSGSPRYAHLEGYANDPRSGSRHKEHADGNHSGLNSPRSNLGQVRKLAAAPGSPQVERFTYGMVNDLPSAWHRQPQKRSGTGSISAPRSPKFESQASPSHDTYAHSDSGGRSFEQDHTPRLPDHDSIKGPMYFAGLLKRSIKDRSKGGQGGGNRRKVTVNGYLISEAAIRKAEERAGPIHSGTYWYDYQAGFWGVLGGPCLGIVMPFIEEFSYPLARDCAGGRTGILINGRELHDEDLEVLVKRGLPTSRGKAYILDITGALFDDISGQSLKGLGKLAPSIEKRGRGYGMSTSTSMG